MADEAEADEEDEADSEEVSCKLQDYQITSCNKVQYYQ